MFAVVAICAAMGAATCFGISASRASVFGNAPWCAVVDQGAGNVMWNCEYDSVEECVPNVLAGNRGFCNVNPYWRGADAREAVARHWHKKRSVEQ
jgi:hypothetical protein